MNNKYLRTVLAVLLLVAAEVSSAHAPPPVAREGALCPPGYYRNSGYCVALSSRTSPAIPRSGSTCPPGYYRNSGYCVKNK